MKIIASNSIRELQMDNLEWKKNKLKIIKKYLKDVLVLLTWIHYHFWYSNYYPAIPTSSSILSLKNLLSFLKKIWVRDTL